MCRTSSRIELQELLETILGSRNVYFQPPPTVRMQYPAIVYSKKDIKDLFADNTKYKRSVAYTLIVIDPDPDSIVSEKISNLKNCSFDRHYTSDNLNHDVYTLFY